jgi:hypothetical protein
MCWTAYWKRHGSRSESIPLTRMGYIEDLLRSSANLLGPSLHAANQQLYRIDRDAVYPNFGRIFRGGVDVDLIPERWEKTWLMTYHFPRAIEGELS